MFRTVIAVAAICVSVTGVLAQSNIIKERQALMKRSGEEAKVASAMLRGETPFNLDRAKTVYANFAEKAAKLPSLFPPDSKTGETIASPAIWEKDAEFKATIAKFAADVKSGQDSLKDLDSFKAGFAAVGKNCAGCHETFRVKKS